jgi:histidinol-phosphatase
MGRIITALAHSLADAASLISLAYHRQELHRWTKADGSLATAADIAVEDELRRRLNVVRPGDAVLGEERGLTGSGPRRWIIDAIDGTIDFAAGGPDWGTLVALEVDGRLVVSVCDEPVHERRYWAVRGGGAWLRRPPTMGEERLHVSAMRDLGSARSYVPPPGRRPDERARRVAELMSAETEPRQPIDHPAFEVATGARDVAIVYLAGPWDLAAPALIVEEAGGRFTDWTGASDVGSGTALFSNGHLHDAVLDLIARA